MKEPDKSRSTNWLICIAIVLLFLLPYQILNHLPLHRRTIPFLFGEQNIPFLPWTFVIYLSAFLQSIIILRNVPRPLLMDILFMGIGMACIGLCCFVLIPIEYHRDLYNNQNSFIAYFRMADGPGNCFPSLHVSTAVFLTFGFGLTDKSKILKKIMWIWTLAIIVSVLTTKQHYIVDIFGAILLVIPFAYMLKRKYRPAEADDSILKIL